MKTLLALCLIVGSTYAADIHLKDGSVLYDATIKSQANGIVTIEVKGIGERKVPLASLSDADQATLKGETSAGARTGAGVAGEEPTLSYTQPVTVQLRNGATMEGVTQITLSRGRDVALYRLQGVTHVKYDELTQEWQEKLKPEVRRLESGTYLQIMKQRTEYANYQLRMLSGRAAGTLIGKHSEGVKATLTITQQIGKKKTVSYPTVILQGLPGGKVSGPWNGVITAKEVWKNHATGEVMPVFTVK